MKEFDVNCDVKDDKKWAWKAFFTVVSVVAVIVWIIGLFCGKVVEATLFEEIAKWGLGGIVLGLLIYGVLWVPITALRDMRRKLYPEYGKKWFKQALKEIFKKK